ncbi:MAG TPA: thrombospondin type 3 repeat-containing protein [Fibrobacteraceae bacterium]|nr:thrombospondin type 3 repeat-containing protein [Fibrobacteraceae bacterium]
MIADVGAAVVSNQGFWGYGSFPSSRLQPQGDVAVVAQNVGSNANPQPDSGTPNQQINAGLVTSILDWLELGAMWHQWSYDEASSARDGELSLKIQIPRLDSLQPQIALGIADISNANKRLCETLYFVAGYEFRSQSWLLALDVGALYHRHRNPFERTSSSQAISFLGLEADLGLLDFLLEADLRKDAVGVAPSLWLRPLAHGPGDQNGWIAVGGGARLNMEEPSSYTDYWGGLQLRFPLGDWVDTLTDSRDTNLRQVSNAPWLWLEINPVFDHAYSSEGKQYRVLWDLQAVTRMGIEGLYWVNGFVGTMAQSRDKDRLSPRAPWDRSYLLYSQNRWHGNKLRFREPQVGLGLLQVRSAGLVVWQELEWEGWRPWKITASELLGERSGASVVAHLPLHPRLSGFMRWTQLAAEGGKYADEALAAFALVSQGSERNALEIGVGYNQQEKAIVARADCRFDLSGWTRWRRGSVQISAFSSVEHRFESGLTSSEPDFTPELTGNGKSNLVGIPWEPRRWQGDSLRVLLQSTCRGDSADWDSVALNGRCSQADFDQDGIPNGQDHCPDSPEDRDGFLDEDGCSDPDNDQDRIPDTKDQCPNQAEDYDGFEDEDGCPDLDNDQDGVPDSTDACMSQPEDRDGFLDEDGCPDVDNDGDGVPDARDLCPDEKGPEGDGVTRPGCKEQDDHDGVPQDQDICPSEAEDLDGFEDWDGCPDPDNDHDGIPDESDLCPNKPEIMDGIEDADGCP